ncbi:MAG: sulfurtransferase [Methanotrichaceae archaeon]|nr:sulfurtransferase [Methanotrichaceae archaeon]
MTAIRYGIVSRAPFALLLVLTILVIITNAGEYGCESCKDAESSAITWLRGEDQKNATTDQVADSTNLNMPQKSRLGVWNEPVSGFRDEISTSQIQSPLPNMPSIRSFQNSSSVIRTENAKKILIPISDVSDSDIFIDISENATEHIKNSIAISYEEFIDNASVSKSVAEISKILGNAGISQDDSVIIYGECLPCGGGPAPATYAYWVMKSLGHDKVRLLDGTLDDWKTAGKSITTEILKKPKRNYTPEFNPEFSATYAYLQSSQSHIVDARTSVEYAISSIPGALNIPSDSVIRNGRLKDEKELAGIFTGLSKDYPVVVYTGTGIKASVVWFALELLGYDAKLYSFKDWLDNQKPKGNAT